MAAAGLGILQLATGSFPEPLGCRFIGLLLRHNPLFY